MTIQDIKAGIKVQLKNGTIEQKLMTLFYSLTKKKQLFYENT